MKQIEWKQRCITLCTDILFVVCRYITRCTELTYNFAKSLVICPNIKIM